MYKIILACSILISSLNAQNFENFDIDNSGLPNNYVTSILLMDRLLWFTTSNGLVVYDGLDWNSFSESDGLSSNKIFCSVIITETSENRILLGTDNGTSSFRIENQDILPPFGYYSTSSSNILSDNVLSVLSDLLGNKWLGTDKGISVVTESDSIINLSRSDGNVRLNNDYINSIAIAADTVKHFDTEYIPSTGLIYAATNGGGISRFYMHEVDGLSSASIVQRNWSGLPSDTVLTVFVDSENNHWYGTTKGVASHKEHDSKNANWIVYNENNGLINNRVTAIAKDSSGNLWFGTIGGISKFDGEEWQSFSESDGLIDNHVTDIAIEDNNNIWISTKNGVSKLSPITFVSDSHNMLPSEFKILLDAYPNPFNPEVTFLITLNSPIEINLVVFNLNGELVKTIYQGDFNAGSHKFKWNGDNNNNLQVNTGIYFVRAISAENSITKKIIFLK